MKNCPKCSTPKALEDFPIRRAANDGRYGWCKQCSVMYMQKHYLANPEQYMLNNAKTRANKKNIDFDIGLEDIFIPITCPVLNITLERALGSRRGSRDTSPTLDRIDNTKGYIKGNVRVISGRANRLKSDASPEELILIGLDAKKNLCISD